MELAGLKGVVCHHCQQPASHFCSECDQYYCNVAADTHSSRRTSHKMEDLQQVKGMEFIFQSTFDTNGLFFWLGTNKGTTPYSNPATIGKVKVTRSSDWKGQAVDAAGREPVMCSTTDQPGSWYMFDIGPYSIQPTCYSLRHGALLSNVCARNWTLQGSNDALHWDNLKQHKDDSTLNDSFATGAWEIPNINKSYRYLRILQTGVNADGRHTFRVGGFEVYGKLE